MFFGSKGKIKRKTLQEKSEKKAKFKVLRIFFYLLASIFVFVMAYAILFSSFLEIKNVHFEGTEELDYKIMKQSVDDLLNEKYAGEFPKNNLLIILSSDLEKRLKADFRKISSVNIKKIFPDTLLITVKERKALLIWCSGEKCLLVDESGAVYSPADFDSPEVKENNLIIIHDQSQSEVPINEPVFNPKFGSFLIEFRKKTKDVLNIEMDSNFETPRAISGDLTGLTQEGWRVNLNAEIEVDKEIAMLKIVMDKNIDEEKRKTLEYIDPRTEGKVYYKFKNPALEEVSEEKK